MGLKTKLVAYLLTFGLGYGAGTVYAPTPKTQYNPNLNQKVQNSYNAEETLEKSVEENMLREERRKRLLEMMK